MEPSEKPPEVDLRLVELDVAADLEALDIPYDDPYCFPAVEPQPRCLFPDDQDPSVPVGYSSLPGGTSFVPFYKSVWPVASMAIIQMSMDRHKYSWVDERIYWTEKYWFFRVVKK